MKKQFWPRLLASRWCEGRSTTRNYKRFWKLWIGKRGANRIQRNNQCFLVELLNVPSAMLRRDMLKSAYSEDAADCLGPPSLGFAFPRCLHNENGKEADGFNTRFRLFFPTANHAIRGLWLGMAAIVRRCQAWLAWKLSSPRIPCSRLGNRCCFHPWRTITRFSTEQVGKTDLSGAWASEAHLLSVCSFGQFPRSSGFLSKWHESWKVYNTTVSCPKNYGFPTLTCNPCGRQEEHSCCQASLSIVKIQVWIFEKIHQVCKTQVFCNVNFLWSWQTWKIFSKPLKTQSEVFLLSWIIEVNSISASLSSKSMTLATMQTQIYMLLHLPFSLF